MSMRLELRTFFRDDFNITPKLFFHRNIFLLTLHSAEELLELESLSTSIGGVGGSCKSMAIFGNFFF